MMARFALIGAEVCVLGAGAGRLGRALGGFQLLRLLLERAGTSLQLSRCRRIVDRLGQASATFRLGAQSLHTHAAPPVFGKPECPRCRKPSRLVTLLLQRNINDSGNEREMIEWQNCLSSGAGIRSMQLLIAICVRTGG